MKIHLTLTRTPGVKWSGGARKSRPWADDEYLVIDGLRCTYTITAAGVMVHLPGNKTLPLMLVRDSFLVWEPKRWRAEDYE